MNIGTVPYLNARPLVAWFTDTPEGKSSGFSVVDAVPSKLETWLSSGEIAVGLLSSVQAVRHPERATVGGLGIACDGPVESVRVFTRVPIDQVKSVALDTSSLTSVALTKIVLADRFGLSPSYISMAPDKEMMLAACDAALLIGDLGYRNYDNVVDTIDLGESWKELTGLPFVYALWIGASGAISPELNGALAQAARWGVENLETIARRYASVHGESVPRARHYLMEVMRYELDDRYEQALLEFGTRLRKHGLA